MICFRLMISSVDALNHSESMWHMGETVAIRLENLTKIFGWGKNKIEAVKDADLEVEAGQVYGFLGPNGAGKTTSIRMMMDLMRPDQGSVYIYGQRVRQHHQVLRRIGALVEGAAFYPYLSGRKNLEVLARTFGVYDRQRIESLLEQVRLAERPKLRYKKYSMGMKQRLGLAAALLHDPELLILDEPTNGLDPAGIQEMRTFIRDLVYKHGKTVFLSSHMLNEVEQVCDRVAIIDRGRIIREGRVADLLAGQSQIRVQASPIDKAQAVLQAHWPAVLNGAEGDALGALVVDVEQKDVPQVVRKLVENDIEVYEVVTHRHSLEEVFLTLTGGQNAGSR